jgi:ferredoxin
VAAFLSSVAVISLSGVTMPGPTFSVTVGRGYHSQFAGIEVAAKGGLAPAALLQEIRGCIECWACVSACPVVGEAWQEFGGPLIHRELARLKLDKRDTEDRVKTALSRVYTTAPPARHALKYAQSLGKAAMPALLADPAHRRRKFGRCGLRFVGPWLQPGHFLCVSPGRDFLAGHADRSVIVNRKNARIFRVQFAITAKTSYRAS